LQENKWGLCPNLNVKLADIFEDELTQERELQETLQQIERLEREEKATMDLIAQLQAEDEAAALRAEATRRKKTKGKAATCADAVGKQQPRKKPSRRIHHRHSTHAVKTMH
jgi:hypothetical protein